MKKRHNLILPLFIQFKFILFQNLFIFTIFIDTCHDYFIIFKLCLPKSKVTSKLTPTKLSMMPCAYTGARYVCIIYRYTWLVRRRCYITYDEEQLPTSVWSRKQTAWKIIKKKKWGIASSSRAKKRDSSSSSWLRNSVSRLRERLRGNGDDATAGALIGISSHCTS